MPAASLVLRAIRITNRHFVSCEDFEVLEANSLS